MKNIFKFFSLALLAGSMMLVSCGGDDPEDGAKTYKITVNTNNDAWGTVVGAGTYEEGTSVTLTAAPKEGYEFVQWQDGVKEAVRTIIVTKDETYTATFQEVVAAEGVNVTFGSDSWEAGAYAAKYYESDGVFGMRAFETQGQLPYVDIYVFCSGTGTISDTYDTTVVDGYINGWENNNVAYIEYGEEGQFTMGSYNYGDWWAQTATINVTAFDATAMTASANVSCVMFSAYNWLSAGDYATKSMNVAINNVEMQAAKGAFRR